MATDKEVTAKVAEAVGMSPEELFPFIGDQGGLTATQQLGAQGISAIGGAVGQGLRGMASSNLAQDIQSANTERAFERAEDRMVEEQGRAERQFDFDREQASFASRLSEFNEDMRKAARAKSKFDQFLSKGEEADQSRQLNEQMLRVQEGIRL